MHKKISYLNAFYVGEEMKLLMIPHCALEKSSCEASADIYDFNLRGSLNLKYVFLAFIDFYTHP